eukprot:11676571-Prorocentrum_lima.AAC.1
MRPHHDQRGNSQFQALSVRHLWGNSILRALMSDLGEPFAMWDSGASHFLLPMTTTKECNRDQQSS